MRQNSISIKYFILIFIFSMIIFNYQADEPMVIAMNKINDNFIVKSINTISIFISIESD